MRVIAGSRRSLQLTTPSGMLTRPTTDRIKETLFNMIQNNVPGSVFVDLFAGSGGIGIEALSRGADKAYFIDQSSEAISCITANLKYTGFEENTVVWKGDCLNLLDKIKEKVTIIFMDPPYHKDLEKQILSRLSNMDIVDENTLIIVEADLSTEFHDLSGMGFRVVKNKCYKTNQHVFIRRTEKQ